MHSHKFPILEYDPETKAIIEPSENIPELDVPEHCIMVFYGEMIKRLEKKGILQKITQEETISTSPLPVYTMNYNNASIVVMVPGITAPFAAGNLEFIIATGCKKIIVIGSCGVLDKSIERNQLIVPFSAIRDEGTSYHYIPASREIQVNPVIVARIQQYLDEKGIKFISGKTWTTDGFYRETPEIIKKRKEEGAIAVEMEASALLAVAQFRNVDLGYILAGGDDVSGLEWDRRESHRSIDFHERFFWLAVEICLKLI